MSDEPDQNGHHGGRRSRHREDRSTRDREEDRPEKSMEEIKLEMARAAGRFAKDDRHTVKDRRDDRPGRNRDDDRGSRDRVDDREERSSHNKSFEDITAEMARAAAGRFVRPDKKSPKDKKDDRASRYRADERSDTDGDDQRSYRPDDESSRRDDQKPRVEGRSQREDKTRASRPPAAEEESTARKQKPTKTERKSQGRPRGVDKSSRAVDRSSRAEVSEFETTRANLLRTGDYYEDVAFPPRWSSIGKLNMSGVPQVVWKRPKDILKSSGLKPMFMMEGASRHDLDQGQLGK
jgi:hypothetical protein